MLRRPVDISMDNRRLGNPASKWAWTAGVVGVAGLGAGVLIGVLTDEGINRFLSAYLVNYMYFLSLGLGALFFVILQHLTRSGWSVVIRRLAETVARNMLLLALLCLPVLLGLGRLYSWADPETASTNHLLHWKRPYLNSTFFILRVIAYFAVWVWLARYFFNNSVLQDRTGDVGLTVRMQKVSAPAMVAYAITITFAGFDLLMSLDPYWYSTIFGVYFFSGGLVGFLGLLALMAFAVQRSGRLTHAITSEHFHDMGKLIFAFVVFWGYIAFSQYMLIWYADIPEETSWYLVRQSGDWAWVSLALLAGHFFVPFLVLISRYPKRRKNLLVLAAVWVLVMHWLDVYWLVMPAASSQRVPLHLLDFTCFVGIGGLYFAATVYRLRDCSLIPERDPRLSESLAFENV
ncbi:MAG: hypothetical protein JSU86_14435 [Phycisphaerales bacterium]|nr:MAG: hypothetical protein JSU86_14435 [Phycisphaerales bacterium]